MPHILTIDFTGRLDRAFAPFVCAPLPELGAGDPRHAPTLVPAGPDLWRLRVMLHGVRDPLDTGPWVAGVRPLALHPFKLGTGFAAAPEGSAWRYALAPAPAAAPTELFYYSGWRHAAARVVHRDGELDVPLERYGPGRVSGESLWTARLPDGELPRGWGFHLIGPDGDGDRPPGLGLYRPLGSRVYLADGEIFAAAPPARRSPPRIETVHIEAPELDHAFSVHVVLPRDYDVSPDRAYPLMFLNDGHNQLTDRGAFGGWHTDTTADRLMRQGRMRDAVLAAVEMHPDRDRALLPEGDRSAPHGQAATYTDLLAGRAFDVLQSRYRLLRGPETTAIIGASNGAVHAVYAGLHRPDAFGLVGSLSYAVLDPERNQQRIGSLSEIPLHRVYLDSGTRWAEHQSEEESDDFALVTYGLRELLLQRGMVLEGDLRYVLGYGDAHYEPPWRRRVAGCLEFLLPPP